MSIYGDMVTGSWYMNKSRMCSLIYSKFSMGWVNTNLHWTFNWLSIQIIIAIIISAWDARHEIYNQAVWGLNPKPKFLLLKSQVILAKSLTSQSSFLICFLICKRFYNTVFKVIVGLINNIYLVPVRYLVKFGIVNINVNIF